MKRHPDTNDDLDDLDRIEADQQARFDRIVQVHPRLQLAGTGKAPPRWLIRCQHNIKKFAVDTFP